MALYRLNGFRQDFFMCPIIKQEGPWALDLSPESLSGGEDVYQKI